MKFLALLLLSSSLVAHAAPTPPSSAEVRARWVNWWFIDGLSKTLQRPEFRHFPSTTSGIPLAISGAGTCIGPNVSTREDCFLDNGNTVHISDEGDIWVEPNPNLNAAEQQDVNDTEAKATRETQLGHPEWASNLIANLNMRLRSSHPGYHYDHATRTLVSD